MSQKRKTILDFIENKILYKWIHNDERYVYVTNITSLMQERWENHGKTIIFALIIDKVPGRASIHFKNIKRVEINFAEIFDMHILRDTKTKDKLDFALSKFHLSE